MIGKIQGLVERAEYRFYGKLIWGVILDPLSRLCFPPEYRTRIISGGPIVDEVVSRRFRLTGEEQLRRFSIGAKEVELSQMKAGSIWFELRLSQLWWFRWPEFRMMAYLLSFLNPEETVEALRPESDASRFKRWRCLVRKAWLLTLVYEYPAYYDSVDPDGSDDTDSSLKMALLRSVDSTQELWRLQRRMPSYLARQLGRDYRRYRLSAVRVAA